MEAPVSLDDQLREDLRASALAVPNDMDTALSSVRRRAARQQRTRRVIAGAVTAVLVAVVAVALSTGVVPSLGETPQPAGTAPMTNQSRSTAGPPAGVDSTLTGEWQSATLPAEHFSAAIRAAGLGRTTASHVLAGAHTWVVQLTFGTSLTVETWDPADPSDSLRLSPQYGYRVMSGHRLVVTALASPARWSFSYRLSGDRLLLHYLRATAGSGSELETARFVAWAAQPLTLVHF
jgi:hypothetical protein